MGGVSSLIRLAARGGRDEASISLSTLLGTEQTSKDNNLMQFEFQEDLSSQLTSGSKPFDLQHLQRRH